ncbi:hypothetical protein IE077_001221, partial [Cardiosporidium cionae]
TILKVKPCQDITSKLAWITSSYNQETLGDLISSQLNQLYCYQPPSLMDDETTRRLTDVFEKFGPEGITVVQFEKEIVIPILKLGPLMSETLFKKIDRHGLGKIHFQLFKEFFQGRFILGERDASYKEAKNISPISYAVNETLIEYCGSQSSPGESSDKLFHLKPYSVMNFFNALRKDDQDYLEHDDFLSFLNELLRRNYFMAFLAEKNTYASNYRNTTIARIMYNIDKETCGCIYLSDLRNSPLVHIWCSVEFGTELCSLKQFFSYEQFYVLIHSFSDLDQDHDLYLSKEDLLKMDNHALSKVAGDRFLMIYEDMTSDRSMEFWFKIVDLDGDGCIRDHELKVFLEEQISRLSILGHEEVKIEDWICQMNDAIHPNREGQYYLSDFKRCPKFTAFFFGSLVSLTKWVAWEHRDIHRENELERLHPDFITRYNQLLCIPNEDNDAVLYDSTLLAGD